MAAFNDRIIRMPFSENYPYTKSSGFWQFIHPVIMATLRSYLKLNKGQDIGHPDDIADKCWRYLKNPRQLLYRLSCFSQRAMFSQWNSEAAKDEFSDIRSITHDPSPADTDDTLEEATPEPRSTNPFCL